MTVLPTGWTEVALGEVAESVKNGIFVSRPGSEPNGVPILRISAVRPGALQLDDVRYSALRAEDLAASGSLLSPGDLLFTRYNGNIDYVGACALVPDGVGAITYPDKLIRVRVDERVVDSRFLRFAFESLGVRSQVRAVARTTAGQAGISGASLKKIRFPLPPLAEQHRIVVAMEEYQSKLERGLAGLGAVQARAQIFADRLRELIVRGQRLPAEGGPKVGAPVVSGSAAAEVAPVTRSDWMPNFKLPDNWSWSTLGELSDSWGYGTSTKCAYGASGVPVLRIPNVQNGEIDFSDMKYAVDDVSLEKYFVAEGDLLFVRTNGSPQLIGRVAVIRRAMPVAFASYLIRFRLRLGTVDPEWVGLVVSSPTWRRHLQQAAASSAGQHNLNSKQLARLPIPVPPLYQQQALLSELLERLAVTKRVAGEVAAAQRRARALRDSLLAEAVTGRLVPQDPNDAPVSELLALTRAKRSVVPIKRTAQAPSAREELVAPPTRVTGDNYQQEALPL